MKSFYINILILFFVRKFSNSSEATNYRDDLFSGVDSFRYAPKSVLSSILILGNTSQAIFAYPEPSDVFIAASKYGRGKILVETHLGIVTYLKKSGDLDSSSKKFMQQVRQWLSTSPTDVNFSEIIDLETLTNKINADSFQNYKIITWHLDVKFEPNQETIRRLLEFLHNGGGLVCSSIPWSYVSRHTGGNLVQSKMFHFLKIHSGIILNTDHHIKLTSKNLKVSENKASFSHLASAFSLLNSSYLTKLSLNYISVAEKGVQIINEVQSRYNIRLIDSDFARRLFRDVQTNVIRSFGWNLAPSKPRPVKGGLVERKIVRIINELLIYGIEGVKAPNVKLFPGDAKNFTYSNLLKNMSLSLRANFADELISTGFYLPAGYELILFVNYSKNAWHVQIGQKMYSLYEEEEFYRYPVLHVTRSLTNYSLFSIHSAFGGLVYFKCEKSDGVLNVNLTNVVQSSSFNLATNYSVDAYKNQIKNSFGVWTELSGKHITFTLPSKTVRTLTDPLPVLKFFDKVIELFHRLRGSDVNEQRPERYTTDIQIMNDASMTAGYPIFHAMQSYDSIDSDRVAYPQFLDLNFTLANPAWFWGILHELGHMMERPEWTFNNGSEVLCNIFVIYAYDKLLGVSAADLAKAEKKMFEKPLSFSWLAFALLVKHFGWKSFETFFSQYERDIKSLRDKQSTIVLMQTDQEKVDQWILRYSRIVGRNVRAHFEIFSVRVNESVVDKQLKGLEMWSPGELNLVEFLNPLKSEKNKTRRYCELPGISWAKKQFESYQECEMHCFKDRACTHFVWNAKKLCRLKKNGQALTFQYNATFVDDYHSVCGFGF